MGKKNQSTTTKKNKSGKGKFFLGALVGAATGAFTVFRMNNQEKCPCKKAEEKTAAKKTVAKKTTAKKPAAKKTTAKKTTTK